MIVACTQSTVCLYLTREAISNAQNLKLVVIPCKPQALEGEKGSTGSSSCSISATVYDAPQFHQEQRPPVA